MKNKRGLSGVIITMILIAISLAVVGIVWFVINGVVESSSSQINESSSQVFQTCSGAGYYKIEGADECLGVVKYAGGEKCCEGDVNVLNGLVSWWSFDVNASDDWGSNDGTVNGATWNSTGGFNGKGAYEFDGVDDYVDTENSINIGTLDFTLSVWVKFNGLDSHQRFIFNGNSSGPERVSLWKYSGSNFYFDFGDVSPGDQQLSCNANPSINKWYHIVGTAQRGGIARLYINGTQCVSESNVSTHNLYLSNNISIGKSIIQHYMNGTIDEVRIYNRALSVEEITKLYELD